MALPFFGIRMKTDLFSELWSPYFSLEISSSVLKSKLIIISSNITHSVTQPVLPLRILPYFSMYHTLLAHSLWLFIFHVLLNLPLKTRGLPCSSVGKESSCNAGDRVQFLGWENPLGKKMATHSSILAWRIPWTEKPSRLQSMGLQESDTT